MFWYCISLTSVTIGNGVTSIGHWAFHYCDSLENVYITDLTAWCNINHGTWSNPLNYARNLYLNGELLTDIVIPQNVTEIKNEVFVGYYNLKSVTIGDHVTSPIGGRSFQNCYNLKSVTIGSGVTYIEPDAFLNCSNIFNVSINSKIVNDELRMISTAIKVLILGEKVIEILDGMLKNCNDIRTIKCLSSIPPKVGINNFTSSHYQDATLYVPKSSLAAYKAAEVWKNFKNIVEFDPTAIENIEADAPAFEFTDGGIQLTTAEGKAVAVYTTGGALVEKIDSYNGEEISLGKGVYVVRVGNKSVKVKL